MQGIVIGTLLGSLAAGLVLLHLNYVALGNSSLARKVSILGALLFIVLLVLMSLLPNTAGFGLLRISIQAIIAYLLAAKLQGPSIAYHRARGGEMHSNLRAAGVALVTGLVLIVVIYAALVLWSFTVGELPAAD